ncbi:uncharacterized protein LOC142224027 [Haematobia irritans]|uniref:uncharacterized protein LOC142224027 n=1 Tax=Haematobia irritans TaxID=7368 RepID=UPI003F4FFB95
MILFGFRFLGILILRDIVNAAIVTKEYLDPSDIEDTALMWKHMFIKLNTVLSETEKLGIGLAEVTKRLDELHERQGEHKTEISKLAISLRGIRQDLNKKHGEQVNHNVKILEKIDEIKKNLTEKKEDKQQDIYNMMLNFEEVLQETNERQAAHTNDISKLIVGVRDLGQIVNKKHSESMKQFYEIQEEFMYMNPEGPISNFNSQNIPEDKEDGTSIAGRRDFWEMKRRLKILWDTRMPVNAPDKLEKTKTLLDNKWSKEMAAKKRLDEIKRWLQVLWESEIRSNETLRMDEVKLELNKFWNSTPEVKDDESNPWIPILRRQDGSVDFNRNWTDYKNGFGDVNGEFFIGLEKLHKMTTNEPAKELLVILIDFGIDLHYAIYDQFQIAEESEKYTLTELGEYSGNTGDSLRMHKGSKFSTKDQHNSAYPINCATLFFGGWWFMTDYCYNSFLSGIYKTEKGDGGIMWTDLKYGNSMAYAEMLIRSSLK